MGITDLNKKYELNEIVKGDSIFCATGITSGNILSGIDINDNNYTSETLVTHKNSQFKEIIKDFQSGKYKYIIANPRMGGYGITLTAAKTVIYYANTYDLEARLQSEDRPHRIGQTSNVTYIDFVTPNTIDEKIFSSLKNKKSLANSITGDNWKEWI
jgi:hypothetical protein